MADSKIHPPSASRIEQARSAGLAPRPVLVGLAGTFAALSLCVAWQGPTLSLALHDLLRGPLVAFAAGQPEQAANGALLALRTLALHALLMLGCCFGLCALALFVAQGKSFGWPGRDRARFAEPAPVRGLALLSGVVLSLVAASLLRDVLWVEPHSMGALLSSVSTRTALALLAISVIDAAFARAAFYRGLWLSRREQRDELREAYGSPEVRAARERVRRESAREVA